MKRKKITNLFIIVLLTIASVITLFPIVWTTITSLKTDVQMFSIPPDLFPNPATSQHYKQIISEGNFLQYLRNSIVVAFGSCSISLLVGIPAAYGFAKFSSNKMRPVFAAVTAVRMIPQIAMVIPFFMIIKSLKLSNSAFGLMLTYIPFEMTLIIWILKNFFEQLPLELEEAAEIDGLGVIGRLCKVIVPLSKGSIGVSLLMAFLFSWNEFMFALSLTSTVRSQTLTIGIAGFVTSFQTFWGRMSAMGILFLIPAIILAIVFQKDLVKGFTAGAIKG